MATEILAFAILTYVFYHLVDVRIINGSDRSKAAKVEAEGVDLLEDEEHRRAIEEFDRRLQEGDEDGEVVLSEPLRDPQQVAQDFITGWVRYLTVMTYRGEVSWGHYVDNTPHSFDARYSYKTEVDLAGHWYEIRHQRMENRKNGFTEDRIQVTFADGEVFKGICVEGVADDLFLLARASSRDRASPSKLKQVTQTIKEHV